MKKMMFLSKNWYFSVQKALIYYTFNKSHHNSFILLVFSHVANFRYVVNFRFLTLVMIFYVLDIPGKWETLGQDKDSKWKYLLVFYLQSNIGLKCLKLLQSVTKQRIAKTYKHDH